MSRKPLSNVGMVCDEHAPKPQKKFAEKPAESYVGHYVKKAFHVHNPETLAPSLEHMWVLVKRVSKGKLEGTLGSAPVMRTSLKYGDRVKVELSEIEEFLQGDG